MAITYHKWNIIIPTMECQEFFNPTCEKIYIFQIVTTKFYFYSMVLQNPTSY